MANNPILPLYYNDIDRSTRDWTDEEFGCYMRLLMHQWAQGEIPKETQRLSRIVTSMQSSWPTVGKKFVETQTGMINERLEKIRAERLEYLKKQQENGKKGGRKPKINPTVNPSGSTRIEYEDEEENESKTENTFGKSENLFDGPQLVPTMCRAWYSKFPTYTKDQTEDFAAAGRILQFMIKQHGIANIEDVATRSLILSTWDQIAFEVEKDTWWVNMPLKSIAGSIQKFYNSIKNPLPDGKSKISAGNLQREVADEHHRRYGKRQPASHEHGH